MSEIVNADFLTSTITRDDLDMERRTSFPVALFTSRQVTFSDNINLGSTVFPGSCCVGSPPAIRALFLSCVPSQQDLKARDAARHVLPHVPPPHVVTALEYNGRSRPQPKEWVPDHIVWQTRRRLRRGNMNVARGGTFTDVTKPEVYADARPARPRGAPNHLATKCTEETQNMWFLLTGSTRIVGGETLL